MKKLVAVFLLAVRFGSAMGSVFTDVEVTFDGTRLSAASALGGTAICYDVFPVCLSGDVNITGLVLSGSVIAIGDDYRSQWLANGELTIGAAGTEPLVGRFIDAQLTKWMDESFFGLVEMSGSFWTHRWGTTLLGIHFVLPGSLHFSDDRLNPFEATIRLDAYPMYDEPATPEPGTYGPLALGLVSFVAFGARRRCLLRKNSGAGVLPT